MSTIIRVTDIETSGLDPAVDAVVEVATVDVVVADDGTVTRGETWSTLVNPRRPIPCTASAVHHITDADVVDAPAWGEALTSGRFLRGPPRALCAHNARFERGWIKDTIAMAGIGWIDTYKVALILWPDAPSHGNQALRYWFKLALADHAEPHRALGDAYVTAAILRKALISKRMTIDEMDPRQRRAGAARAVPFR